jgi:hypothetical protein
MRLLAPGSLLVVAVAAAGCGQADSISEPRTYVVPVFAQSADGGAKNLRTHLTGGEENPPNASQAQGQAVFQLSEDGTELSYRLIVANIENVTQAHIHKAPAGANGGVVVWLYPSAPPSQLIPGSFSGTLGEGTIADAQVVGSLAGTGVAGLLAEIRAGNTYVNVHTSAFPPGEIRGQID